MKEYWVWDVNAKKKYKIKGKPVKIVDWLGTFIQKNIAVSASNCPEHIFKSLYPESFWNVAELKTGALISEGRTQKEAIATAKWKLEKKGRLSVVRQVNKHAKQYGTLNKETNV